MKIKSILGIFRTEKMADESSRDALSGSDDDEADVEDEFSHLPELCGVLSKWTNYIHGWQDRFIVVKNGTISYYKSEEEASVGCRGTVSLSKAVISAHEFDDCRFDVGINDCLWYLRAQSSEERLKWMAVLEKHKQAESGYGSENSLRRHGSHLSLASTASLSTASASSFKRGRGLQEKLLEMETFKDTLYRQVDNLQNYFDACASVVTQYTVHDSTTTTSSSSNSNNNNNNQLLSVLRQHGAHAVDFKGESINFKSTAHGILATMAHCIELMSQREEAWKKKLEREIEKRKRLEDGYKHILTEKLKPVIKGGPDYEEGPHSMLNDEEFFDAIDATLDKMEKEEEEKLKLQTIELRSPPPKMPQTCLEPTHPLYSEINRIVDDHIKHADMSANDVADTWTLVASEGEMKVYKREVDDGGEVVYPLKAVHTVKGITGHELCYYFWEPSVRLEWESTLETTEVIEWLSSDTHITCQVLKRVWPAAQRDSMFWSTIRHCPPEDEDSPDYWIVANHSTDYLPSPPDLPKCIRLQFNVAMIAQTIVQPPANWDGTMVRDALTCRIQYSANVNPGGWVPSSVIQAICKREAPKFLKNFTNFVIEKTKNQPIMI
ncbi:hypothetical protein HELRODRAFT_114561 [Helobdella robusta]|uniref:Collagen type IV alpha-3-binding protein n=1 Tax=Helobdella robusta TaxID=6412 RepID=T1EG30_HELRO|nr:hypothetical protein HELRODRAFT_114561 [Helobdella robusta]ESN95992.1 hypothetical protein HELRODRAFT_114561 [Helobdella robusta]